MSVERFHLSPDQAQGLVQMEADLKILEDEIRRAKRAGLDVSQFEQRAQQLRRLRTGLLREFGPAATR